MNFNRTKPAKDERTYYKGHYFGYHTLGFLAAHKMIGGKLYVRERESQAQGKAVEELLAKTLADLSKANSTTVTLKSLIQQVEKAAGPKFVPATAKQITSYLSRIRTLDRRVLTYKLSAANARIRMYTRDIARARKIVESAPDKLSKQYAVVSALEAEFGKLGAPVVAKSKPAVDLFINGDTPKPKPKVKAKSKSAKPRARKMQPLTRKIVSEDDTDTGRMWPMP